MPSVSTVNARSVEKQRDIFILSDLHLGGRYPDEGKQGVAGFRMMNHASALAKLVSGWAMRDASSELCEVVINGDFVDFLAEEDDVPADAANPWKVFRGDPTQATTVLRQIIQRDECVFDALALLVRRGHRLTILLGNHDIELSLPAVREVLAQRLGADDKHSLRFIYDGEAYVVGDALIEHGNRYDRYNQVRFDDLRELRSLQSRRQEEEWQSWFTAPPGSYLVVEIMNHLKRRFPWVDLLKPEGEVVLPLLLALDPQTGDLIEQLLWTLLPGHTRYGVRIIHPAMPRHRSTIAADDENNDDEPPTLRQALRPLFATKEALDGFVQSVVPRGEKPAWARKATTDIRGIAASNDDEDWLSRWQQRCGELSRRVRAAWAKVELLLPRDILAERLPALLAALRVLQDDHSFDPGHEKPEYLEAARRLAKEGRFRFVIFGHTHLAKTNIPLGDGATYWNSGTWCGLMRVPESIINAPELTALSVLQDWVDSLGDPLRNGREWIGHDLTYIALRVNADGVAQMPQLERAGTHWPDTSSGGRCRP